MKTRGLIFLSFALNVVLATVVAWALLARDRAPASGGVLQHLTNRVLRTRKVAVPSAPQVLTVPARFHWSEIESADYRVYMANLRGISCPQRTIRDIIVADVDQVFIQRGRELLMPLNRRLWWMLANEDEAKELGHRTEKEWEALVDERKAVLKELLGHEDPYSSNDPAESEARERTRWAHTLDFLSPEKQEQVLALRQACEQAVRELWKSEHQLTKEERQDRQRQQRELEAGRDQQLSALLTPDERAEYQLRTSNSADLRHRLSRVEFSTEEIRTIARVSNERQQAESQVTGDNREARQRRAELARQADAQLKQTLGETRYAEYQRAQDGRFEAISQVVDRYGLPEATAVAAYDMQLAAEAQATALRKDQNRTSEERQAMLEAIRAETERSFKETLGARVFATLEDRGTAGWLNGLAKPSR